jgi:hypothetical protein
MKYQWRKLAAGGNLVAASGGENVASYQNIGETRLSAAQLSKAESYGWRAASNLSRK